MLDIHKIIENISNNRKRFQIGKSVIRIYPGEKLTIIPGADPIMDKLLYLVETKHNKEFIIIDKEIEKPEATINFKKGEIFVKDEKVILKEK